MRSRLLSALVTLIGLAFVIVVGLRIYAGRNSEVLSWSHDVVDFDHLPPRDGNRFALCPAGMCGNGADAESPVFPVAWDRLHAAWIQAMANEPRLRLVRQEEEGRYLGYVQRSQVFGLPDIITVRFVPEGDAKSSLMIYSAARFRALDFGENRRRVEGWMARLLLMFSEGGAKPG